MSSIACNNEDDGSSVSSSTPHPNHELSSTCSPLDTIATDMNNALDEFRSNWKRELRGENGQLLNSTQSEELVENSTNGNEFRFSYNTNNLELDQQILAENLFHKAVELEQRGKVYDAIPLYRKAIQIVPDIEFRFYEHQKLKFAESVSNQNSNSPLNSVAKINLDDVEPISDLYEKFQNDLTQEYDGKLLLSNSELGVISTELHISDLPTEIILYILRWVVSNQLDMRSLEQCAAVCKGLFLCSRDDELWRMACLKVWRRNTDQHNEPYLRQGPNDVDISNTICHSVPPEPYTSWRQMFIERERVLFNGCYISKNTYIRLGENSFQDQYYRPVQLVEYYRYIRFLPDGTVIMMTNADEPAQGVSKLKHLHQLRSDVLRGHYSLFGSTIKILLKKSRPHPSGYQQHYGRHKRGNATINSDEYNSSKYCIELRIMSSKRKFNKLVWMRYALMQTRNKVETISEFDLTPSKYPPLWFSQVRSYHSVADTPLA